MTHPQDEAFATAIRALGEQHGASSVDINWTASLARSGYSSSAWNDAVHLLRIPADELRAVRALIYGD